MKKCSVCDITKPLQEFVKNRAKPDGYQTECKSCRKIRMAEYYRKNREIYLERAKAQRLVGRGIVRNAKSVPCVDCGVQYPFYVMDFDHRDASRKSGNVSEMIKSGVPSLLAEIEKCDVVCANCHRERTHQRGRNGL